MLASIYGCTFECYLLYIFSFLHRLFVLVMQVCIPLMIIEGPVAVSFIFWVEGYFWKHLDKKIESLKILFVSHLSGYKFIQINPLILETFVRPKHIDPNRAHMISKNNKIQTPIVTS